MRHYTSAIQGGLLIVLDELISNCTTAQPEERPDSRTVVERLSALMDMVNLGLLKIINQHPELNLEDLEDRFA